MAGARLGRLSQGRLAPGSFLTQFTEGAADWLPEEGTREGTRASLHSTLSVRETQASSNPSAGQEWWGATGMAARKFCPSK